MDNLTQMTSAVRLLALDLSMHPEKVANIETLVTLLTQFYLRAYELGGNDAAKIATFTIANFRGETPEGEER